MALDVCFNDSFTGQLIMNKGGKDFPGSYKDVVCLYLHLDVGDLTEGVFSEKRIASVNALTDDPWLYGEGFFNKKEQKAKKQTLERIKKHAQSGEKIRVWYSMDAIEMCSFMFLMSELRGIDCDIGGICLQACPDWQEYVVTSWGQLSGYEELAAFLPYERTITPGERQRYAEEWERLCSQPWPLRTFLNGNVIGVPFDFFDSFLLSYVPEGEFRMMEWLGQVMVNNPVASQYDFWHMRLCQLLRTDRFEMTRDYSAERAERYPDNFSPPMYSMWFKSHEPGFRYREEALGEMLLRLWGEIDFRGRFIPERNVEAALALAREQEPKRYCAVCDDSHGGRILAVKETSDSKGFIHRISVR